MHGYRVFTATALLLTILACNSKTSNGTSSSAAPDEATAQAALKECSRLMKVTFPDSVQVLGFQRLRGLDDCVCLKVQFESAALEQFLAQSPFAQSGLEDGRRFAPLANRIPWWDTAHLTEYTSGQTRLSQGEVLNIVVSLESESEVVIYLQWHEL